MLLAGFLGATLVRFSPGFGASEQDLDPRLSAQTRAALRRERSVAAGIPAYYLSFVSRLAMGDLGESWTFRRPVTELVRERAAITGRTAGTGLVLAWTIAFLLAASVAITGWPVLRLIATLIASSLISIPLAVIGLMILIASLPVGVAVSLALFPRLLRYAISLFDDVQHLPHVLVARSRGIGEYRVFLRHILPIAAPKLVALAGVSFSLALGATVPIEVVCDVPGIGQLMWQAAQGRDLPLLVSLTLLATTIVVAANAGVDGFRAANRWARP